MVILGISESHDAHACLLVDGVLAAAVAEERLSRLKSDSCYPKRAIDEVLRIASISANEIDAVAFASKSDFAWQIMINKHAKFSVQDWIHECYSYWKPLLIDGVSKSIFDAYDEFSAYENQDAIMKHYKHFAEQARKVPQSEWGRLGDVARSLTVQEHLGISEDKIFSFRHEDCHKAYGYYTCPYNKEKSLIFTLEGGGDDSSATVSVVDPVGNITEEWSSNFVMAGRVYAYITLLLGMKPGQHEYKVMGLAPYGNNYIGEKSLNIFRSLSQNEDGIIKNNNAFPDLYFSMQKALEGQRFDGIAWGLQEWIEELICDWVKQNIKKYGISKIIFSGGVAQNIKALKAIADISAVDWVWAGPISGDGSLGIGAAFLASKALQPAIEIAPVHSIYLGAEYDSNKVITAVKNANLHEKFTVIEDFTQDQVARWIADGNIIGRFSGRMEFGQRALGNRSIIADPRDFEVVEKINKKIKYRDFWMPFTPSMTKEFSKQSIVNSKGFSSPFMTMAFDQNPSSPKLDGVVHPADKTVRPQILKKSDNPNYFSLLEKVEKNIGCACVLNTSFNMHGDPIVEKPEDAIRTFERSELDILLFDKVAVFRKKFK
jgi:carbamoyltransferase